MLHTPRWLLSVWVGLVGLNLFPLSVSAQVSPPDTTPPKLKVGVRVMPPFVIERPIEKIAATQQALGENKQLDFIGIDIAIWQAIAAAEQWEYDYYLYDSIESGLQELQNGELDILLGGVEITAERLSLAEFSQPYYFSQAALLVKKPSVGVWQFLHPFLQVAILGAIAFVLLSIGIFAHLIWWVEKEQNAENFSKNYRQGIRKAYWFTAVTMTTVGYGDIVPKTLMGRRLTLIWMWIGMAITSSVTAALASGLTLTFTQNAPLDPNQLQRSQEKVAVIGETLNVKMIRSLAMPLVQVKSFQDALNLLNRDQVTAILYLYEPLKYYQQSQTTEEYTVTNLNTGTMSYGFPLRPGDQRLQTININLVEMIGNDQLDLHSAILLGQ